MAHALRLLLVEDSRTDRKHLTSLLEQVPTGYEIQTAASLGEARRIAADQRFDAILLDLSLPDVASEDAGIDPLTRDHPDIALVVITGETDPEVAIMAAEHGAEDCLLKAGLDPGTLDVRVRAAVARNRERWHRLQRLADAVALHEEWREEKV